MSINPALVDVVLPDETGYPIEQQEQDARDVLIAMCSEAGAVVTDFPKHLWIEPRDWKEVAAENDKNHTWPVDYLDRFTNQNPTHECTCHSLRAVMEMAWNRQRRIAVGPPVAGERLPISEKSASVWLSPLSVYAEANPRQWGGAGVRQVLSIAARRGMLPEPIQPKDYGFKHTLHGTTGKGGKNQASGSWVSLRNFPSGFTDTSMHFRPLEYIFPEMWEQMVCLVLHGYGHGVGRDGHAVPHCRWMPDDNVMQYADSYDVFRYDSVARLRKSVGSSYSIVSTTIPDDWNKPAG